VRVRVCVTRESTHSFWLGHESTVSLSTNLSPCRALNPPHTHSPISTHHVRMLHAMREIPCDYI
jgi:hypothetical protein